MGSLGSVHLEPMHMQWGKIPGARGRQKPLIGQGSPGAASLSAVVYWGPFAFALYAAVCFSSLCSGQHPTAESRSRVPALGPGHPHMGALTPQDQACWEKSRIRVGVQLGMGRRVWAHASSEQRQLLPGAGPQCCFGQGGPSCGCWRVGGTAGAPTFSELGLALACTAQE